MEFNNREIAVIIISGCFILFALFKIDDKTEIISSFKVLIKSFFAKKIITTVILFSIYMYFEIQFLYKINLIDNSFLKETIVWSLGAFGLIMKHESITKEKMFVKKLIFDNLKLLVLFEFLFNMYTFNLIVEVILVLITTVFLLMQSIIDIDKKEENDITLKVISYILNFIGWVIILFTINQLFNNYGNIDLIIEAKKFFLPLVLIILYIPFYYFLRLYSKYEVTFISAHVWFKHNKKLESYLKRKIFFSSLFNYNRLKQIHSNMYKFDEWKTEEDIDNIIKIF